jgi:enoyl-CoA hydratase
MGSALSASDAYRLGLLNQLVDGDDPLPAATALAEELAALPPLGVRAHVRITRWQWKRPTDEAALYLQGLKLHLTQDFEESTRAFLEKRPPEDRAK